MKIRVCEYINEEHLIKDVIRLIAKGIKKERIYVISNIQSRKKRFSNGAVTYTKGLKEKGISQFVGTLLEGKVEELKSNIKKIGLTEREFEHYEDRLDQGNILMLIKH